MTIQDTVVEILAEKALLKPGDVKLDFCSQKINWYEFNFMLTFLNQNQNQ